MEDHKYTPEALTYLPREELRRILAEELNKPIVEIDDALVRTLMAELHNRGTDPAYVDDAVVEQVCAEFKERAQKAQPHRKRWYRSWMLKVASIALVLGILFFALPGAAQADDIHEVLSWWSDSTFRFFNPGKQPNTHVYVYETDHPGLQQIYDTVTEMGITNPIVPRWIPDEFELTSLDSFPMDSGISVHACLTSTDSNILLTFVRCDNFIASQHEKDKTPTKVWDLSATEHYVLSNNRELIVTWVTDKTECTIISDCKEDVVFRIIQSIYTLED